MRIEYCFCVLLSYTHNNYNLKCLTKFLSLWHRLRPLSVRFSSPPADIKQLMLNMFMLLIKRAIQLPYKENMAQWWLKEIHFLKGVCFLICISWDVFPSSSLICVYYFHFSLLNNTIYAVQLFLSLFYCLFRCFHPILY